MNAGQNRQALAVHFSLRDLRSGPQLRQPWPTVSTPRRRHRRLAAPIRYPFLAAWMNKHIFPRYEEFWDILKAGGKQVIFMSLSRAICNSMVCRPVR
jgi:hypothetical protein